MMGGEGRPRVMIGCPVRDRAWILPRYLQCLLNLDYPQHELEYAFIINDCQDNTADLLEQFAVEQKSPVRLVYNNNSGYTGCSRGYYSFSRLAELRNHLLNQFLNSECAYLFSLDSDILVSPPTLPALLENQCDIVSALVFNGFISGNQPVYNILRRNEKEQFVHITDFARNVLLRVDCTGAACLIKRKVIADYGIRYSARWGAEDIAFCMEASRQGLKIYCDTRVECCHIMQPDGR